MLPTKPDQSTIKTSKRPRYFYGWNIVAASFLAHLAYAEHYSSTLGLFFRPLNAEFGWRRFQIAVVQTIARGMEAVAAPMVGPLIDRFGTRALIPTGAVIVGLTMLAITQINSLWQFYLLRGVVAALGFTLMGFMVTAIAVNNWFIRKRGRAIAIANVGGALSNVFLMPLTVLVLAISGWRTMFVVFGVITWVVVLIPSAILMRRRPEDMGLQPDGIDPGSVDMVPSEEEPKAAARETAVEAEPLWTRKEAARTRAFWLIAGCFAIDSLAFQGINISLAAYIQDLGYSDATVAAAMMVRAAIMAGSLPFMGLLIEHSHKLAIRVIPFAMQGLAAVLFLTAERPPSLWTALALYSIGMSGVGVMEGVVWANYFGRFSLGLVRSMAFFVVFGLGAIGPLAMNAVFDILGSYKPAFVVIAALFGMSALLMAAVRPPTARRYTMAAGMNSAGGDRRPGTA